MSNYGKRILAAGLVVTMAMGMLTGCSSSNSDVVAKMGDTSLTLGEANFMLRYNQAQTQSYLGAMFGEGVNVFQQDLTGNGEAYGTVMKESVLEELKEMTILEQHMADYNVEVTEEEKAAIAEAAKAFLEENDKNVLKAMSATEETVTRVLTLYTIQSKMETAIEADVDTEVTDEEAAQKTIQYAYFSVPQEESEAEEETASEAEAESETADETETETAAETEAETETETVAETEAETETEAAAETETETEAASETEMESETDTEEATEAQTEESAQKKETRETVQGIIDAVLDGQTLEEAVKAVDENKNITDYSYGADEDVLNENLKNAADALTDGQIASEPIASENGFYVVQMVSTFDREATDQKKEEIVNTRKRELYNSVLEGWEPESFEINEKVWSTVTFEDMISLKAEETESEVAETEVTEAESASEAESETEAESVSEAESETES